LPPEVSKVLLHDFKDFISTDFSTLAKHDNLELPASLELFKPDDDYTDDDSTESAGDISKFNDNLQTGIQPIANDARPTDFDSPPPPVFELFDFFVSFCKHFHYDWMSNALCHSLLW
jgi:hypothetical protein